MGVFTAPHYILVYDVVVGLANVRIRHVFKFSESLELPRCDEVVILLPSEHLEYSLSV